MEKRAVAPLVLGGAGLALVVAIAILLVKVRAGAPSVSVSPADEARGASRAGSSSSSASGIRPQADALSAKSPHLASPGPAEPATEPGSESEGSGGAPAGTGEPGGGGEDPASIAEKMTEANRLYDRGDYEAANQLAEEVLKVQPQNIKMLRIGTSTACILGDASEARTYFDQLPERDQQQIARRCKRYGVEL